ncbi:MAG: UDP-2,3-diacylglucosamine diphosphatase [Halioglobus sp.]|nr:UDP-2,3-diacylglucosamine diphosphatase [Halioglobus sp.]
MTFPAASVPDTYFISDLHLEPGSPAKLQALARLLRRIAGCDALYILGDLFDAWIGDDDDADHVRATRRLLRDFSDSGAALYLMHGNRDFLIGEDFCAAAGATLLPDPSRIELYGKPALLMHGDSLCTRDTAYQAFRALSRQPAWRAQVLARSLEERREMAADLRRHSRAATGNKPDDIIDVTPAAVDRAMTNHGVRRLIHGHTHRPGRHAMPAGERWVLGDWDGPESWLLRVDPEDAELIKAPINQ